MASCVGVCVGYPCFTTGIPYGLWLDRCPATDLRLGAEVRAYGLLRGTDDGRLHVEPYAQWLTSRRHWGMQTQGELRRGVDTRFELLRGDEPVEGFEVVPDDEPLVFRASVPEIPDGDYTLVTHLSTDFDATEVRVPLALYAPAIVHVATDRPLYKPGQTVQLRSAVLRRVDGEPLDERPGRWEITAPDGTRMLEERSKGGPWGVSATTFPLSDDAQHGTWTVRYVSGSDADSVRFDVRPFQLPRMQVEASGQLPWFGIGDVLTVTGRVTYASGAPVTEAAVDVQLRRSEGRWPLPLDWEEPLQAVTDADGRFEIEVGEVPADLIERATLSARVSATDAAGETVVGGTSLVVAVDDLRVESVTELGDGLVQGFNNRAYLRVTTPDGRPLPDTELTITRPYDPTATPIEVSTDVDGVAALQIDPGAPVTVVVPAPPVRARPLQPGEATLLDGRESTTQRGLDLPERRVVDRMVPAVERCGVLTVGAGQATVALRVGGSGVPQVLTDDDGALTQCVASAARSLRFEAGPPRTYRLMWQVPDSLQPSLRWDHQQALGTAPRELTEALASAGLEARRCMERGQGSDGAVVADVHWAVDPSGRVSTQLHLPPGSGLSPSALACVRRELSSVARVEGTDQPSVGVSRATLSVPRPPGQYAPKATTRTGYELQVAASKGGEALGETRWVTGTGSIPPLRMRATPSLASPGQTVEVALFRGPDFRGSLPKTLHLRQRGRSVAEADVVDNRAVFTLPASVDGFVEVAHAGARAVVYVQPAAPLAVALSTDQATYRPGDEAQLTVTTTGGDTPRPAAVMLQGVDASLGQLAPLLGPDDFGRVTVAATTPSPAFGFDAKALTLGRVRGANAAQAAVLRVAQIDSGHSEVGAVSGQASAMPAVEEVLSTNFYRALGATVERVRRWEAEAPSGETMQPATMVRLYDEALAALRAEGGPAVDGYGRELTLDLLPDELLAQVDPRVVVADGARLPEDIVSWPRFVAEEVR
jgi:hypothetical protein